MSTAARFNLKMDADEKAIVAKAAALLGTTMACFVRVAAREKAQLLLDRSRSAPHAHQFRANADHCTGPDAEFSLDQFAFHPFSQLGGLAQAVRVFGRPERLADVIGSLNEHMFGGLADEGEPREPRRPDRPGFSDSRH